MSKYRLRSNTSNTRKRVSSVYPNTEMWVEKRGAAEFYLTNFKVFGYLINHSFECLISLLKLIVKCREKEGIKSANSVQIKTGYPNLLHSSDFLCVLVINY